MSAFQITIMIEAPDDAVDAVHEEIAGACEDARESGEFGPTVDVTVGPLVPIGSALHQALIGLARERHAANSDGEIEVDKNATLSIGDAQSGAWVQGWLWVPADDCADAGVELPKEGV